MRRILVCLFASLVLWPLSAPSFGQNAIRWIEDLNDAQHVARRDGRLVLIHFYATWCAPCRKLERDVFPRTDVVAAILRNYVPVRIDGDRFRNIAQYYHVDRYPTDIITDASGRVLYRTVTPQNPIQYIQLLDSVARDNRFGNGEVAAAPQTAPSQAATRTSQPWNQPGGPVSPNTASAFPTNPPASPTSAGSLPSYPVGYERPPAFANAGTATGGPNVGRFATNPYASPPTAPTGAPPSYSPPAPTGTQSQFASPNPYAQLNPAAAGSVPSGWNPNSTTAVSPGPSQTAPQARYSMQPSRGARPAAGMPAGPAGAPANTGQQHAGSVGAGAAEPPPLALDGYCPVTLQEEEVWRKGDPRWGAIHRGRTYLFASQRHQQRFLADPDRYSPVLAGYDPVRYIDYGQMTPGNREHGIWYRGKIYLFADERTLGQFERSSDYYAQRAHEIMMKAGR